MSRWGAWAGGVLVLCYGAVAVVGETSPPRGGTGHATTVTANRLEVRRKEHRAIYTGNVVAATTDLTVTADRMEFDFNETMESVERMIAGGNVGITRSDGSKASADRATYYVSEERVVLEGNARAWQERDVVSGARITLFLSEDRQVVEGDGAERVTAVIYPRQQPDRAK